MASSDSGKHGYGTSLFGLIMIAAWVACMYYGLHWQKDEMPRNGHDAAIENAAPAVPMVIDRGMLLLLQPDLRLTALDLPTGLVIFRGKDEIAPGILPQKGPPPILEVFGNLLLVTKDNLLLTALDKRYGTVVVETRPKQQYEIRGDTLLFYSKQDEPVMMERKHAPDTIAPDWTTWETLEQGLPPANASPTSADQKAMATAAAEAEASSRLPERQFIHSVTARLPGDAQIRVGMLHEKKRLATSDGGNTVWIHRIMEYADAENKWEGRINCLGALPSDAPAPRPTGPRSQFSLEFGFAVNGDSLVYSVSAGRVECLDRKTGKSRWLYAFPRSRWEAWNAATSTAPQRFRLDNWRKAYRVFPGGPVPDILAATAATWGKYYYLEDKALNDRDMSRDNLLGMSVPAEAAPPRPPLNFDTQPVAFASENLGVASVLCRLGSLTPLVVLWVLFAGRGTGTAERIALLVLVLSFNLLVVYFFGLYSRDAMRWMLLALHLAYLTMPLVLLGHRTPAGGSGR